MARIKQVLAERRLAAIEAAQILREKGDVEAAQRLESSDEVRGLNGAAAGDVSPELGRLEPDMEESVAVHQQRR